MFKPIVSAALISTAFSGIASADGYGGHSHPHAHPHTGHAIEARAIDPNVQHSHEGSSLGVRHAHEINGVTVQHTHSAQMGERTTWVDRLDQKITQRGLRFLGRRQVGAGFGPYTVAEWNARAAAGQPGVVQYQEPWPTRRYRGK